MQQIAEALLLSDEAIRGPIEEYQAFQKLHLESGGSKEKLSYSQSNELEAHLEEHVYLYVKDIAAYVKAHWSISYTVAGMSPGMSRGLKPHGFPIKNQLLFRLKPMRKHKDSGLLNMST